MNNSRTNPPKSEELKDIETYAEILKRAALVRDGEDYPNSTTAHAKIGIELIFEVSQRSINIFSSKFSGDFWISLWDKIIAFLEKGGTKLSLITITDPDPPGAALIGKIKEKFPETFVQRQLNGDYTKHWANIPNYITGDGEVSRFEKSDADAKDGYVTAVVNFGDEEKAQRYDKHFAKISDPKLSS